MRIFVTGTDTDVGKTTICSWLCLHTSHAYFKPIQTGSGCSKTDSDTVRQLAPGIRIHQEMFSFPQPVSPHLAAQLQGTYIDINTIELPHKSNSLIVEGVGGLYVPINKNAYVIDLIKKLEIPVILVARTALGTINHTLLSLNALRQQNVPILGVILSGEYNEANSQAIEFYGNVKVLASFPQLGQLSTQNLSEIELSQELKKIFSL